MDASALIKLLVAEPGTAALRRYLAGDPTVVSSRVAAVEVRRVVGRQARPGYAEQVDALLEGVTLIDLTDAIVRAAGTAAPATLRSLDAIHLASAASIADSLTALVTYDRRLADAAADAGIAVAAP